MRGKGHHCKGGVLKVAVAALIQLPLNSRAALRDAHPPIAKQPIPAIAHLNIERECSCRFCKGNFLTKSDELRDRYAAKLDDLRPSSHNGAQPLWDACELQTLFSMTGDIRYFRVVSSVTVSCSGDVDIPERSDTEDSIAEDEVAQRQANQFLDHLQAQQEEHEASDACSRHQVPCMAGARLIQ